MMAISDTHIVYACGDNTSGQLGTGDTEERLRPKTIKGALKTEKHAC